MIRAPGVVPGRNNAPARGIDVGPTLLGLAGLPVPEGMLGLNLLADEAPAARARVIETYGGRRAQCAGYQGCHGRCGPHVAGGAA